MEFLSPHQPLDLSTWPRAEAYRFFRNYHDPFFMLTAPVDVAGLHAEAGRSGQSFFLSYLHCALAAANATEALKLRFQNDEVHSYDWIHAGCTVLREDESFAFAFFPWSASREEFCREGMERLRHARFSDELQPLDDRPDVIFFSVIPWVSFTSFKNPHRDPVTDDIPRIVFGKTEKSGERLMLPVSVEVHHALADGLHVGRFFERFGALCGHRS